MYFFMLNPEFLIIPQVCIIVEIPPKLLMATVKRNLKFKELNSFEI